MPKDSKTKGNGINRKVSPEEKLNPYPPMSDMQKFGYILAAAFGFGAAYVFFNKRTFQGGYAEKHHYSYEDFPKRDIEKGADIEMEHTRLRSVARKIALDHLSEDPDYYRKLELIESGDRRKMLSSKDFR